MRFDQRLIVSIIYSSLSLLLAAAFVGCATPAPLVRLQPESVNVTWVAGRAVVAQEHEGVRVAAAFEHQDGDLLALRLEVENQTDGVLLIDPAEIWFSVCSAKEVGSCRPPERVLNPERVLRALDRKRSVDEADAANNQTFQGTLVMLSAVTAVASIASGRADRTTGLTTLALADQKAHAAARHDSARSSIAAQRQMWSNAALRRNTIQPGRGVGGQVFVPINQKAAYVWVQLRAGPRTFPFHFQQTITHLARAHRQ